MASIRTKRNPEGPTIFFPEPWEIDDLIAVGVVVLCAAVADLGRGFRDGLTETDAGLAFGGLVAAGGEEFEVAGNLGAEIEHNGA